MGGRPGPAAALEDRFQRRAGPAGLAQETCRAHEVVPVARALLDADAAFERHGLQIGERQRLRAGDAGELEAVGLGVDLRVDVTVAAEVAGDRRDHVGQVTTELLLHADGPHHGGREAVADPGRQAVDGPQRELLCRGAGGRMIGAVIDAIRCVPIVVGRRLAGGLLGHGLGGAHGAMA